MSNLVEYAKAELDRAGFKLGEDEYTLAVRDAALELVEKFSEQGHSGFSAGMVIGIVEKLMRFHPLTPLTGEDAEWMEVGGGVFQNVRCGHVFKEGGEAYDIEGRIFREPSGVCFTNRDSRVPVTFPYTPRREYVLVGTA